MLAASHWQVPFARVPRAWAMEPYPGTADADVQQSADLYRRIEGWGRAAMADAEDGLTAP